MTDPIIQQFLAWGQDCEDIRALILTSTRTKPDAKLDPFSDYDLIIAVRDVMPYFESREWLETFGTVLVLYRDPMQVEGDAQRFAYITQYEADFLKIDFSVVNLAYLQRMVALPTLSDELDVGYRVLLDKDNQTADLAPPTDTAFIPKPPPHEAYQRMIELFFHEATYVAKNLWRDELLPAHYSYTVMQHKHMRVLFEWYIQIERDWSQKTGAYGKFLKRHVPLELWTRFEATFPTAERDATWQALFTLIDLFRDVAIAVGHDLGYAYPETLHQRCVTYLKGVQRFEG